MVALEPQQTNETEPASPEPPRTALDSCTHLLAEDRAILENVAGHLPLLADLTHADTVLFARADDQVLVIGQAQPVPVPSPYALPVEVGRRMTREEAHIVFRVLVASHRNQDST